MFFLFLFQHEGTTPGVPLMFFFFSFSTGYHTYQLNYYRLHRELQLAAINYPV
jgi:hypothetical protein